MNTNQFLVLSFLTFTGLSFGTSAKADLPAFEGSDVVSKYIGKSFIMENCIYEVEGIPTTIIGNEESETQKLNGNLVLFTSVPVNSLGFSGHTTGRIKAFFSYDQVNNGKVKAGPTTWQTIWNEQSSTITSLMVDKVNFGFGSSRSEESSMEFREASIRVTTIEKSSDGSSTFSCDFILQN